MGKGLAIGLAAGVAALVALLWPRSAAAADSGGEDVNGADDGIDRNTVGLRNRNPGNLEYFSANNWLGQTGQDGRGYAVFDSDLHGLRAAFIDLNTGFVRDNEDTVRAIISEWAPARAGNPTAAYISFVCGRLGVSADQRLSYSTHAVALIRAIVTFENGGDPYPASLYSDAYRAAGR